jgi:hypothetical protein
MACAQTLLQFSYFWTHIDPILHEHALQRPSEGGNILKSLRRLRNICMELSTEAAAAAHSDPEMAAFEAYVEVMLAVGKFPNPRGYTFKLT